ncbi:ChbG/HpnK family deacetylase [uncultured Legionella sp.]|uniref:ChbG/HpnK family deacetylase n=1 Tax=uncultured Legionella sp. TaxID=210934 RepID=UPI00262093A9|nr:ChbG/HpnK family deacetylase [uncultured Legionella sp.]
MSEFKKILLCADDFGLNPGVSQGIVTLARQNRLSAVSCMVNLPEFSVWAQELIALKDRVKIGLHFNLTEGCLLSRKNRGCFTLNRLLLKTQSRLISPVLLACEFHAQLDRFIEVVDSYPDFIDGHQHIHQLPVIRTIILKAYKERLQDKGVFLRSTYPALTLPQFQFKAAILAKTGGKKFHSLLKKECIAHNKYFAGVYDFSPGANYRALFRQWLLRASDHTLIMCHPGDGRDNNDAIASARRLEMDYFLSDDFLHDCEEHRIQLTTSPIP